MSKFYRVEHTHIYLESNTVKSCDPCWKHNQLTTAAYIYCKTEDLYYCKEHTQTHLPFSEKLA